jgi:DNA-binding transcriptional ArsR family regulator
VPVDDMTLAGTELVSRDAIAGVCGQLAEARLIEWSPVIGASHNIGHARITASGVDAVERGAGAGIDIKFPSTPLRPKEQKPLKRDPQLILKLLEKLEAYPAEYGDAFTLNADDPLLAVSGYTKSEINYHLEQLLKMGLVEDPGSQPAIGITFSGLSPRGHDFLDRNRDTSFPPAKATETHVMSNKVFVVHGHDQAAQNEVALFLTRIGLEPIVLHLRANGGRHLLTKFKDEAEGASFAVVLMTPDDEGGPKITTARRDRARQNVVFELGFFIGRLGSEKVAALMKGDVERPSDFDGIAYIKLDASGRWKMELARELQHANVPFDARKALTA